MTNISFHAEQHESRFNNAIVNILSTAVVVLAGFLMLTTLSYV